MSILKKKNSKQNKNFSIIEQIRFYETEFKLKEENIDKILETEDPKEIISIFYLLHRLYKDVESQIDFVENISNYLSTYSRKIEDGIKLFIDELERERKFREGSAEKILEELGLSIHEWDSKHGNEIFSNAISRILKKCKRKTERVLINFVGENDYKTNLMVLKRTKDKQVKKICLEELERMTKSHYERTIDEVIEIIYGVKKGLYKRDFEIGWRTERVVSAWMNLLEVFGLSEEELKAEGLKFGERMRRRGLKLSKKYVERIKTYLKEEGVT